MEGPGALSVSLNDKRSELVIEEFYATVKVTVQAKQIFNFNFVGDHCHLQTTNDYNVPIFEDEDATFKISVDDGYILLKDDVKIEGLGKDSVSYDPDTKTITITKMSGDVKFTVRVSSCTTKSTHN